MPAVPERAIVREDPSLIRDTSTNAIINRNSTDYYRRLAVKNSNKKKNEELKALKSEVSELKDLVRQLLASSKQDNT